MFFLFYRHSSSWLQSVCRCVDFSIGLLNIVLIHFHKAPKYRLLRVHCLIYLLIMLTQEKGVYALSRPMYIKKKSIYIVGTWLLILFLPYCFSPVLIRVKRFYKTATDSSCGRNACETQIIKFQL